MRWLVFLTALTAGAWPVADGRAEPNPTPLGRFPGEFRGRATVTLNEDTTHRGGARLLAEPLGERGLRVRIDAGVRPDRSAGARAVPVDNVLTFRADGTVAGREIAPGATRRAPFTGTFTATPRRINFTGTYAYGSARGTIAGFVRRTPRDRLIIRYTITAENTSRPIYAYAYTAPAIKRPRR